jgi:sugar (pentulose or hexulose) kinase
LYSEDAVKSERTILSLDIGTTAVKVGLFSTSGALLHSASREQRLTFPGPGRVEQAPLDTRELIVEAVRETTQMIDTQTVTAIALSNHRGTAIALDANGEPLSPFVVWMDKRGLSWVDWLNEHVGSEQYYDRAGHPIVSYTGISKLFWFQQEAPEIWEQATVIAPPQTHFLKWLGADRLVCDVSTGTYLFPFDVKQHTWSTALATQIGFPLDRLPQLVKATDIVGQLGKQPAQELGLRPGVALVAGGGDGQLAGIGSGVIEPGRVMVNIGTGAGIQAFLPEPTFDPRRVLNCSSHAIPEAWEMEGHTQASGAALKWWRDEFGQTELTIERRSTANSYDLLIQQAVQAPPGSDGLLFIPTFNGSSAPVVDMTTRASLAGLGLNHTRHHVLRAVLEGISLEIKWILESMVEAGAQADSIHLTGGGSRNALWNQIHASVLGYPLHVLGASDAAMVGAAMCAVMALDVYPDWAEASSAFTQVEGVYTPDESHRDVYRRLYERYRRYCLCE